MAIRFVNIRSGEEAVAEEEPHISALWASSDHSPNITQGQDFGWRLAPAVLVEMKEVKQDIGILRQIAQDFNKSVEDINEPDILTYISNKTARENAPVAGEDDYTDMYDQEVRRLTAQQIEAKKKAAAELTGGARTEQVESLEDLQKRVELEERLAAARAVTAAPPAPTEQTTTTTTVEPSTTTTTTKPAASSTTTTTTKK